MKLVLEHHLHLVLILSHISAYKRGQLMRWSSHEVTTASSLRSSQKVVFGFSIKLCSFQDDSLTICAHTSTGSTLGSLLRKLFFEIIWKPGQEVNSALSNVSALLPDSNFPVNHWNRSDGNTNPTPLTSGLPTSSTC